MKVCCTNGNIVYKVCFQSIQSLSGKKKDPPPCGSSKKWKGQGGGLGKNSPTTIYVRMGARMTILSLQPNAKKLLNKLPKGNS